MLQIRAPALSQIKRGPNNSQDVPVPGKTTNVDDFADNPINGTDAVNTQRLEGEMNHKYDNVMLQLITDSRRRLVYAPRFDCLNKNTPDIWPATDSHSRTTSKSKRVREQGKFEPVLYRINIEADELPMMNEGVEDMVTLSEAGPGGRTDSGIESGGRTNTRSFSSIDDELKTRLTTASTREQKDISMFATAAYFSGRIVMLVTF
jgi:hypothetical protein